MNQQFTYHRAVAPLMWVFVAIASVELVVTHLLVATFFGTRIAMVLSVVTAASVLWLILAIRAMRRLPVELDAERLVMRSGRIKQVEVPAATVAGIETTFDAASLKDGVTLNLALIAYPNVVVVLDPPYPGRRRSIRRIAHRLDDPASFAQAIERLVVAR